jgi:hypothetical protein
MGGGGDDTGEAFGRLQIPASRTRDVTRDSASVNRLVTSSRPRARWRARDQGGIAIFKAAKPSSAWDAGFRVAVQRRKQRGSAPVGYDVGGREVEEDAYRSPSLVRACD